MLNLAHLCQSDGVASEHIAPVLTGPLVRRPFPEYVPDMAAGHDLESTPTHPRLKADIDKIKQVI